MHPSKCKVLSRSISSDLLPISISRCGTVIINTDPHTEKGSHWLGIHLEPRSSSSYYFDSYDILPIIPNIRDFLKRNCAFWYHKSTQLQGLMSTVCGHYCCIFALYMDRGFTPKQFVGLFNNKIADKQTKPSPENSDHYARNLAVVNAASASIKGMPQIIIYSFLILTATRMEAVID